MLLFDVNVWVYAHREDAPNHKRFRQFTESLLNGDTPFGVSTLVLSGFLRIVTHPKVFDPPTPTEIALAFVESVLVNPDAVLTVPGARHWEIFTRLCRQVEARGNLVPDAYLAALAIEHGMTWVTTDRDYSRFAGLAWKHPLTDF